MADELRLLLLEDDDVDAKAVCRSLATAGSRERSFHIERCSYLADALRLLDQHEFDAALLDLTLPDSTGVETVHQIQSRAPGLPIVVLTGRADPSLADALLESGVQDFMTKRREREDILGRSLVHAVERQRLVDQLREERRELERSNQELAQFAHVASHDLQEPLRMVASFTQLLARRYGDQLDDTAMTYIGYAVDGAKRMQALIRDLLRLARVDQAALTPELVDCQTLVDRLRLDLRDLIEEASAQVSSGPMPTVVGFPSLLERLLRNLVTNAIKFRSEAELPRIHITASREARCWRFAVRDNGIGVDEQHRDRIFEIFQRLNPRHDHAGSGIGLALCKKIVLLHGGEIGVERSPDGGSVFWFTLPAERPEKGEP